MNLLLFENDEPEQLLPPRDPRAIHLIKVLRKGPGDAFAAGVLGGKTGKAQILSIEEDRSLRLRLNLSTEPEPLFPLELGVGFPRPIQLRRLLRELSTLGLAHIHLFGTELGEKSYRDTKLLQDGGATDALIEGAVQARSTLLPQLHSYYNLDAWLSSIEDRGDTLRYAPDNIRPQSALSQIPVCPKKRVLLAVGPERGWSDREREQLEESGFIRVSMGSRAMRTETASVAAAVLALEKMCLL